MTEPALVSVSLSCLRQAVVPGQLLHVPRLHQLGPPQGHVRPPVVVDPEDLLLLTGSDSPEEDPATGGRDLTGRTEEVGGGEVTVGVGQPSSHSEQAGECQGQE